MATQLEARKAEIARDLEAGRAELLEVLSKVPAGDWERSTTNPGWTVRDVLAHVATGETSIQALLRRLAAGQEGVPDDFDLARYNASQLNKRAGRSVPELLAELETARAQTLEVLAQASAEALAHSGRHPRGMEATLEQTLKIVARHDREHAEDIRRAVSG